jgi:hypothetical protein
MPVDYPDSAPGVVRRPPPRLLIAVLSFLVTLGALLVIAPLVGIGSGLT